MDYPADFYAFHSCWSVKVLCSIDFVLAMFIREEGGTFLRYYHVRLESCVFLLIFVANIRETHDFYRKSCCDGYPQIW